MTLKEAEVKIRKLNSEHWPKIAAILVSVRNLSQFKNDATTFLDWAEGVCEEWSRQQISRVLQAYEVLKANPRKYTGKSINVVLETHRNYVRPTPRLGTHKQEVDLHEEIKQGAKEYLEKNPPRPIKIKDDAPYLSQWRAIESATDALLEELSATDFKDMQEKDEDHFHLSVSKLLVALVEISKTLREVNVIPNKTQAATVLKLVAGGAK